MESPLNNFNESNNFWESNPQFKVLPPFSDFYKKNRSKKKSSTVMWAVAFAKDPDSLLFRAPLEDRIEGLNNNFLKGTGIDLNDYKHLLDAYEDVCLTYAEKSLSKFYDKLKERDDFLANQKYSFTPVSEKSSKTQAEVLDGMIAQTSGLYKKYKDILNSLEEESSKEKGRGGHKASMSDSGEI